ncbi:MAG: GNAT family N-acetyltransferase [Vicinamibacterales bacterium]
MTSPTSIRLATTEDSAGILECLRLAFEPYRERYTSSAFADTVLSIDTLRHRLSDMSVIVAVGESGNIIGTIGYATADQREGHLRGMAVLPDRLGCGIAQRLLDRAESELRRLGCSRVTLNTTEPLTRAIRFYERNGFRRSGIVCNFFGMPLIEYVKSLGASPGDAGNGR